MLPTVEHVLFIPGVFLVGLVVGYVLGSRAVRRELEQRRSRLRE
jgi:hypothetical protein